MNARIPTCTLLLLTAFAIANVAPAVAQALYENGPINGNTDAWTINFGFVVSDSFTISGTGPGTLTGVQFGAWLSPGTTLDSVDVWMTSELQGGTTYFDQQVNVTQSGCALNQFNYDVCTETASFNGPILNAGTYWLNLQNAVDDSGTAVYWDENSGIGCHSEGCPSLAGLSPTGSIPSEAFTILGNGGSGSVPEPASLALFASGVIGFAGVVRRKLF